MAEPRVLNPIATPGCKPESTGCDNQCCGSPPLDLNICALVLSNAFLNECTFGHDITSEHPGCFVGMTDDLVTGTQFCLSCDTGCFPCRDNFSNLKFWGDRIDGSGYLRPNLKSTRNRDARNQLADAVVINAASSPRPFMFTGQVELERAACYRNDEHFACWGPELGHPCHCYHEPPPDCDDYDPPLLPADALPGFLRDRFFFRRDGWPPRENEGLPDPTGGDIYCRDWRKGAAEAIGGPSNEPVEHSVIFRDDGFGQSKIGMFYRRYTGILPECNTDLLVACSALVPGASRCSFGLAEPATSNDCDEEFECGCDTRYGGEPRHTYYCQQEGATECNRFEYLKIFQWNAQLGGDDPETLFKNLLLQFIQQPNFPDLGNPFDSAQHQVGPTGDNSKLGLYEREYVAPDLASASQVFGLPGRVKWADRLCPVNAIIVMRSVRFRAHVRLHHIRDVATHWGQHHVVVLVEIKLGVLATLAGECTLNGEPLTIEYDPDPLKDAFWFPRIAGGPNGNGIVFEFQQVPIDIPLGFWWHGRLNNTSTPANEPRVLNDTGPIPWQRCTTFAEKMSDFIVPGLVGDIDNPENSHPSYQGQIRLGFSEAP